MKDLFKERLCRMEFCSQKRKKPRLNACLLWDLPVWGGWWRFSARTSGKTKQNWQHPGIHGYIPSRNSLKPLIFPSKSPAVFLPPISSLLGRSQVVQARTCHPMGTFWAALLGWKSGPWGLGSCRALGETGLNCSRHGAKLEEVGSSFVPRRKRWVSTPVWSWPPYKGQHMAALWGDGTGPCWHLQFNSVYC